MYKEGGFCSINLTKKKQINFFFGNLKLVGRNRIKDGGIGLFMLPLTRART